jgi:hypothetical protein
MEKGELLDLVGDDNDLRVAMVRVVAQLGDQLLDAGGAGEIDEEDVIAADDASHAELSFEDQVREPVDEHTEEYGERSEPEHDDEDYRAGARSERLR